VKSVILWHPGSSVSTSDVAAGIQDGLEHAGVKVLPYRAEAEIAIAGASLEYLWRKQGAPEKLRPNEADKIYRSGKAIVADAARARIEHGVEWVFVVSGMYQHPDYYILLRSCGFKVALVCTETPYDIEYELRAAKHADVVFTNERSSLPVFQAVHPRAYYLPHAWHPGVHLVMAEAARDATEMPAHDVVFVGTFFQERIDFLASIDWTGIDLGLYGGTEDLDGRTKAGKKLKPFVRGQLLRNAKTAALYRQAKVGLNFHRTSKGYGPHTSHIAHAESINPRCYELAATGCYFVTDYRAEMQDVFGDALQTFTNARECEALIREALADDAVRLERASRCRQAVQAQTWRHRTSVLLDAVGAFDAQRERAA
jgi:spore maturation protein CgeB